MASSRSTQMVVIIVGYMFGVLALIWGLPEHVLPSVTIPGRGIVWLGAPMAALLLPTAIVVTDRLLRGLCVRHPVDAQTSMNVLATYDAVMLRVSVFIIGVHVVMLLAMLGVLFGHAWAGRIVPLMFGMTMISIGNLLPRTRPNLAIGIRTSWHAFRSSALGASASVGRIHDGGVRRSDCPVSYRGARPTWRRDDSPGWARGIRRNLAPCPHLWPTRSSLKQKTDAQAASHRRQVNRSADRVRGACRSALRTHWCVA